MQNASDTWVVGADVQQSFWDHFEAVLYCGVTNAVHCYGSQTDVVNLGSLLHDLGHLLAAGIALGSLLGEALMLVEICCLFEANGHVVLLDKVQNLEGMTKGASLIENACVIAKPTEDFLGGRQVDALESLSQALPRGCRHRSACVALGLIRCCQGGHPELPGPFGFS